MVRDGSALAAPPVSGCVLCAGEQVTSDLGNRSRLLLGSTLCFVGLPSRIIGLVWESL